MTSEKFKIEKSDGTVVECEPGIMLMWCGQMLSAPPGAYIPAHREVARHLMDTILGVAGRNGYQHCVQLRHYLLAGMESERLLLMCRAACSVAGFSLTNALYDMNFMS